MNIMAKSTKRGAKQPLPPVGEGPDHGTPERVNHSPLVDVHTDNAGVFAKRVVIECVLDRYHERMQITDRQYEAGLRLRSLCRAAILPMSVVGSYGDTRGGGSGPDGGIDARRALRNVLLGSWLADRAPDEPVLLLTSSGEKALPIKLPLHLRLTGHVALAVCGVDEWAGGTRRLMLLRDALSSLADFWKIETDD